MTYIVNRRDRFYVVAYEGIDPISGRDGGAGTRPARTVTTPRSYHGNWSATPHLVQRCPRGGAQPSADSW